MYSALAASSSRSSCDKVTTSLCVGRFIGSFRVATAVDEVLTTFKDLFSAYSSGLVSKRVYDLVSPHPLDLWFHCFIIAPVAER